MNKKKGMKKNEMNELKEKTIIIIYIPIGLIELLSVINEKRIFNVNDDFQQMKNGSGQGKDEGNINQNILRQYELRKELKADTNGEIPFAFFFSSSLFLKLIL